MLLCERLRAALSTSAPLYADPPRSGRSHTGDRLRPRRAGRPRPRLAGRCARPPRTSSPPPRQPSSAAASSLRLGALGLPVGSGRRGRRRPGPRVVRRRRSVRSGPRCRIRRPCPPRRRHGSPAISPSPCGCCTPPSGSHPGSSGTCRPPRNRWSTPTRWPAGCRTWHTSARRSTHWTAQQWRPRCWRTPPPRNTSSHKRWYLRTARDRGSPSHRRPRGLVRDPPLLLQRDGAGDAPVGGLVVDSWTEVGAPGAGEARAGGGHRGGLRLRPPGRPRSSGHADRRAAGPRAAAGAVRTCMPASTRRCCSPGSGRSTSRIFPSCAPCYPSRTAST